MKLYNNFSELKIEDLEVKTVKELVQKHYANLYRASLNGASLDGANLDEASLNGANLNGTNIVFFQTCPKAGDFIAFKKGRHETLIKLKIPWYVMRTSCFQSRKCRAELAIVLDIWDKKGKRINEAFSKHYGTVYIVGEFVRPDSYDDRMSQECSNGIHFFMTMEEALNY